MSFPTGLAPGVGQQITVNGQNLDQRLARLELLKARAEAGDGDLIASGLLQDEVRGMLYLGAAIFQTDRKDEGISWQEMLETVEAGGALLTFTVVPPGSGFRIGVDQDSDGVLNGDETPRRAPPVRGWQRRR